MSDWNWSAEQQEDLAVFLEKRGLTSGPVTTKPIGDGHSNLTYLVSDARGSQVVLRRPPPPPTPPGGHDMLREARIIGALADTPVPVAELHATSVAGELLDVDFYVMGFSAGPVITTTSPAPLDDPAVRRRLGESLVDTLADLHAVDWQAVGLGGLGRPEGFNARHLSRMARLVADADGNPPAHFAAAEAWLRERVPAESGATIVHNDFRIGNVVCSAESPGTIAAVLDWELATLGDPLFDLGYFLASVPVGAPVNPTQELSTALLEDGYPTRDELAARYAERTGADLSALNWYTAAALWKLAVLYEYGRRRAVRGVGDPYYADQALVQAFLVDAHRTAGLPPPPEPEQEESP
ncbi:phosphotransferase family protein [Nocardioides sp. WS12]|uniref:phosphotransferase family protein n=1 Tax=Nocardioides sp. WS12 TaxID=2486272 RepID=UPI0015F82708|nr:phosphotransferase family protein [Nocardioides sp. WS12]